MPGGVLLQELLPKGSCACPLLSSHSGFIFFSLVRYASKYFSLLTFYSISYSLLPCSYFPVSHSQQTVSHSLSCPSLLLTLFLIPLIFSLLALPSPLRHQLYTHRLCFHGVSHRFWQSALETQDHFK